jgi:hypothetical protein
VSKVSGIEELTMNIQSLSQPQLYEIRFRGHLGSYRAQMFEGLEMVQGPGGETVLSGPITDQAALHGILGRIRDLGVPLLSVKCLPADSLPVEQNGKSTVAARTE